MSFWGATVITNLLSAIPWIGNDLVTFIWGSFCVENPTLNRFFSLHFLLPFVLTALVLIHMMALHMYGSNNPLGISSNTEKLAFHPYYTIKDLVGLVVWLIALAVLVFYVPNILGRLDLVDKELLAVISIIAYYYKIAICWKPYKKFDIVLTKRIISNLKLYSTRHVSGESFFHYLPLSVKMNIFKQSAGNRNYSTSSSETTCDFSFNKKSCFNSWLAGLIDGDGSIGVTNKGKTPYLEITLAEKDVKVLYYIKNNLGFGSVTKRTGVRAYRYRVGSITQVKQILDLTACYMITDNSLTRLQKLNEFYHNRFKLNLEKSGIKEARCLCLQPQLQPQLQHLYKTNNNIVNQHHSTPENYRFNEYIESIKPISCLVFSGIPGIPKTNLEKIIIIKNTSWLTGFFDAEGHFSILNSATLTINISQKEISILSLIKTSFSMGHIRYDKSWNGWSFMISKKEDIRFFLTVFFCHHKIQSLKAVDRKTFLRLLSYIDKNYHLINKTESRYYRKFELLKSKFKKRNVLK